MIQEEILRNQISQLKIVYVKEYYVV